MYLKKLQKTNVFIAFFVWAIAFILVITAHAADREAVKAKPVLEDQTVKMTVTAYCLCKKCCGKWASQKIRVTSTGDDAFVADGVAVDPRLIPYRTKLQIPGVPEIKEADDTGGAMRKSAEAGIYHIDLRVVVMGADGKPDLAASHKKALEWGRKELDVKIVSVPKPKPR